MEHGFKTELSKLHSLLFILACTLCAGKYSLFFDTLCLWAFVAMNFSGYIYFTLIMGSTCII